MGHLFVGQQRLDESPMKDRLVEETLARLARAALRLGTRRFVVAGGKPRARSRVRWGSAN